MESDNRPVRVPIIVDWSGSNDLICQRHQVPNCRRRSDVLEVWSSFRRQAPLPELVQLCIRLLHTRVELVELIGVREISRDGLVDGPDDGIVPEGKLFRVRAEAYHVTGAGDMGKVISSVLRYIILG